MEWRRFPAVYEVNTWAWLARLRQQSRQPVGLGSVPDAEISRLADLGFDAVWLMGVWRRGTAGRKIAREHPQLELEYRRALPDFRPDDVVGSPYAVQSYEVDPSLGSDDDLASLRARFQRVGIRLILDFVCNHLARDHAWVKDHPERFLVGSDETLRDRPGQYFAADGGRVFAHGRDPHLSAWSDTVQLDYRRPDTRQAMAEVLAFIADRCDGVRCDMAMLLIQDVFLGTWGGGFDPPDGEFWPSAIGAAKARHPDLLMIAEAYWGLELRLQQLGFDYTYDKTLYDLLARGGAAAEVWSHLLASGPDFQRRLVRFTENHDEERAPKAFGGRDRSRSAATLVLNLPGMRLYHEGQLEGAQVGLPVQLGRRPPEPVDETIARFYRHLLEAQRDPVFHDGEWSKVEVLPADEPPAGSQPAGAEGSSDEQIVAFQWSMGEERRIVAINLSAEAVRCRLRLETPGLAGAARFRDLLSDPEVSWSAGDLSQRGLPLELPGYGQRLLAWDHEPAFATAEAPGHELPPFGVPLEGARLVRIFVASPGDVKEEREHLASVIDDLGRSVVVQERKLRLELSRWEKDALPGFDLKGPQGLVDAILHPADCDVFIGIFGRRFGTPVQDAASGSEHEFRLAYGRWRKERRPWIMVYFDQAHHGPQSAEAKAQAELVASFQQAFPGEGLWWPYDGPADFKELVREHLTRLIGLRCPLPQTPSLPAAPPDQRRDGMGPELSSYVERPALEAQIVALLGTEVAGSPRLITLHGSGGMGKTRLARACGGRLATSFRDGVFFVSLDGIGRSVEAVAEAVASQLGIKGTAGLRQELLSYLRSRRLLLILDNYESVAGERVAVYLAKVLSAAAEVRLLVTGRQPVKLGAMEQVIDLDDGLTEAEARELFTARARLRKASWQPDAAQQGALGTIIALTERIPLAIEFAAAWVARKSLAEIAASLAEPGGGEPPPGFMGPNARHTSLWKCQGWSFHLLSRREREVFVELGIFPETFSVEAAARVCSLPDPEARDLIFELQDSALIRQFGPGDPARFGMPRFTRQYAAEKLRRSDESFRSISHRFAEFYACRSDETIAHAARGGAALAALAWIQMEWRNLCAAAEHAVVHRSWEAVERLSSALVFFLPRRGRLQEGEELYQRLLDLAGSPGRDPGDAAGRGTILNTLGVICQFRKELDRAERFLLDGWVLRRGRDRAKTLNSLGAVYQTRQRWSAARECHEESLALCLEVGDRHEEAMTLNSLGLVYACLDDLEWAVKVLERSLRIWQTELGDPAGEADALNSFGVIYQRREDWPRAHESFEKRLGKLEAMGDRVGQARTLSSLGHVAFRQQQFDAAERYYRRALTICEDVEDTVEEGEVYRNLGELFEAKGDLTSAAEFLERSWPLRQGADKAQTSNRLGEIRERQGLKEAAVECYRRAQRIARSCDRAEEEASRRNLERVLAPSV